MVMRSCLVYVAGPLTRGDLVRNVKVAHHAGRQLIKAGYPAYVPHSNVFWGNVMGFVEFQAVGEWGETFVPEVSPDNIPYNTWIAQCLVIVARCDALIRLPGDSPGSDMEAAEARRLGIPVYDSVEDFLTNNKLGDR